jgi:hypothetical protein
MRTIMFRTHCVTKLTRRRGLWQQDIAPLTRVAFDAGQRP